MCQLNTPGATFAALPYVNAMTDVTGFGLLGHLLEICEGSNMRASIAEQSLPLLPHVDEYRQAGCVPGGTDRNFASYGHNVPTLNPRQKELLCDPQTSGGLLVTVSAGKEKDFIHEASKLNFKLEPIGTLMEANGREKIIIT